MRYLFYFSLGLGGLVVLIGGGYFAERYLFSNMGRDLQLNSGRREFSETVNFSNFLKTCESLDSQIAVLEAELAQYNPETQPTAWRMANQNLLGTETAKQQCMSGMQSIIDTTEIESVPEFSSLHTRYLELKNEN